MRKVKFNRPEETNFLNEGTFLTWGVKSSDKWDKIFTNTVALIELEDGTVEMVDPGMLRFEKEVTPTELPIEDLIQANEQAKYMVAKLGAQGARVQCLQEMRDTSNSEHYRFWSKVNRLIPKN